MTTNMTEHDRIRRALLLSGASATLAPQAFATTGTRSRKALAKPLPQRGDVLIRNAYVMSMDPAIGDLERGDVLISKGQIAAVGARLDARPGKIIDGTGMLVMPGFIDTHTHFWSTQMRGNFGDSKESIYFLTRNSLANGYRPDDMYIGTLLGATEAIHSGITTAVDFCHNARGAEFVDSCVHALSTVGLRTRFLYGASTTMKPAESIDLADLERLAHNWTRAAGDAPLTLGLAWRGPLGITTVISGANGDPAAGVAKAEFDTARRLGLPIGTHVSGALAAQQFAALVDGNYLGRDVQLVHMSNLGKQQLAQAAAAGSPISITPLTELRVGYGVTQLADFVQSGARLGLGIDSNSLAGASDMFSVMKLSQLIEAGRTKNELATPARKLLELATIEGARALGMDDRIGSLTVGKRADLIMIDLGGINMGDFAADPAHLLVEAARPENVSTVMVDGRILKEGGRLTALDSRQIVAAARESITNIVARVKT